MAEQEIHIGISSCLLGNEVRYDGGHKRDPFLINTVGRFVNYVPVCPEVECGLPVPREAMHLVKSENGNRLMTVKTNQDITEQEISWAEKKLDELAALELSGFIFKSKSPSSGLHRIKIYNENGEVASTDGVGIFAGMFTERFPLVPVEDEGRLHDPAIRENFFERIFVMKRWQEFVKDEPSVGGLVAFHTSHKLLIMSHSIKHYRSMGSFVAKAAEHARDTLYDDYLKLLMEALEIQSTRKKNVNVLHHIIGYFKNDLTGDEKQEVIEIIHEYSQGFLPLIVPITLLNHFARKYQEDYLLKQVYLKPHPIELKLRTYI